MGDKEWAGVAGMIYGMVIGIFLSRDVVRFLRQAADVIENFHSRTPSWGARKAG